MLIRDDETALAILHQLRAIGVRIALDDFGTGFSSLSYLKRFPFDKIKIDRCFVSDIEVDGSAAIVQAVVNIAAARNMTTTAEGVETEQQRRIAAQARLHPDAGLSVQRAEAERRKCVLCSACPQGDRRLPLASITLLIRPRLASARIGRISRPKRSASSSCR